MPAPPALPAPREARTSRPDGEPNRGEPQIPAQRWASPGAPVDAVARLVEQPAAASGRQRTGRVGGDARWALAPAALVALDASAAVLAELLLGGARGLLQEGGTRMGVTTLVLMPLAWVAAVASQGGYRSPERQRFATRIGILLRAAAWFLAVAMVVTVLTDVRAVGPTAVAVLGATLAASAVGGWMARLWHASHRRRGNGYRDVFAVGPVHAVQEYAVRVGTDDIQGVRLVGVCTPVGGRDAWHDPVDVDADTWVPPISDLARDLVDQAVSAGAHEVVVLGGTDLTSVDYRDLAWLLDEQGMSLSVLPLTWDVAPHRISIGHLSGLSPVVVRSPRHARLRQRAKSVGDRLVAALVLTVLWPVLAAVAFAIRLDSPGPAIFRQERVGVDGRVFTMLKFRSMCTDAERLKEQLADQNKHAGVLFKMEKDPRITRVGSLLRKTSLDELPQLINVVAGQMSIVGPRPALPSEVAAYDERARRRLAVKPGLTGLWQVSGRSDLNWATSLDLDLRYIERWSLALDASIVAKTVGAVVLRRGAY